MSRFAPSDRRTLTATALAIVGGLTGIVALTGARPAARGPEPVKEEWLARLTGAHRQLFDAPTPNGGIPLVHVLNYYDTYNKAFGVADKDVNGVLTFYGATTFYALNDAAWAKYRLGEFLDTKDAKGTPATANPWRTAPEILGMTLPQASVESLQQRGATFILCNNALTIFSGLLAKARGLDANAVYQDLKANILPGVTLVPGMVVAIEQAQRAGLTYHRQ
jgi:intracellular sulfur oxidation DsrE/DsrF family protein